MSPTPSRNANDGLAEDSMTNVYRAIDLSRRMRYTAVFSALMIIVFVFTFLLLFLAPPIKSILAKYDQLLSSRIEGMKEIPNIEEKLRIVQKQIDVLTTQSVETRLSRIEQAIKAGNIDTSKIASFQSLKQEFQKMKTFMYDSPDRMVELRQLQRDYQILSTLQDKCVFKESFEARMSYIWNVYFVTLAFVGILFTVFLGSWWFTYKRIQQHAPTTPVRHPEPVKPQEQIGGAK